LIIFSNSGEALSVLDLMKGMLGFLLAKLVKSSLAILFVEMKLVSLACCFSFSFKIYEVLDLKFEFDYKLMT
jgi:hypothetical protein